jgi:cation:H+ antiporter
MKPPAVFFFGAAALYFLASYVLGEFPRWIGFVMLGIFVIYMITTVRNGLKNPDTACEEPEEEDGKQRTLLAELILLVIGAAVIAVGAELLVEHGQVIARSLGVPETVVALLFVALGTSLPELITTIASLRSGHASLGVGNVIGANVFNLVLVSGVAVSLAPFRIPCENFLLDTNLNMTLVFELPVMLGVMSLMIFPALATRKLHRWQGIVLLGIYAAFCVCQFIL